MKSRKLTFLFTFCLFCQSVNSFSQTDNTLKGVVVDESNRPIVQFNVFQLSTKDSSTIEGRSFRNGRFVYPYILSGPTLLKITSLGFTDRYLKINSDHKNLLDTLVLHPSPVQLKETTITSSGPEIKMQRGKTILAVSSSPLKHLDDVTEILRRAPDVRADDKQILVLGKGVPLLLIDGKEVSYQEVKMLQPGEIVSVELDTNPSARYEATYRSVIRIKTKRLLSGSTAQVYNQLKIARVLTNKTGVQLQYNKGKWVNYLAYSYLRSNFLNTYTDVVKLHQFNNLLLDSSAYRENQHYDTHQIIYGSQIQLNRKNSLQFQYQFYHVGYFMNSNSVEFATASTSDTERLNVMGNKSSKRPFHQLNLYYAWNIDSVSNLTLTADYSMMRESRAQVVNESNYFTFANNLVTVDNDENAKVFSFKTEYSRELLNHQFQTGIRYSILDNSTFTQYVFGKQDNVDTRILNDQYAVFMMADRNFKKWGYSFGLRSEWNHDWVRTTQSSLRDAWDNRLFPSIGIHISDLFKNTQLSIDYASKFTRASITDLDPALNYDNRITVVSGNPLLHPTIYHTFTVNSTVSRKYVFIAEYRFRQNGQILSGEAWSEDPAKILLQPSNLSKASNIRLEARYSTQKKWVSLSLRGGIDFTRVKLPINDNVLVKNRPNLFGQIDSDIKLGNSTFWNIGFMYYGRSQELMSLYEPTVYLSTGLTQYFFKRSLSINIPFSDILRQTQRGWTDQYGNFEMSTRRILDTRFVRISIRYNFRKFNYLFRSNSISDDEINRLR